MTAYIIGTDIQLGTVFGRIQDGSVVVFGGCRVISCGVKGVEVESLDGTARMAFTPGEFRDLHPVLMTELGLEAIKEARAKKSTLNPAPVIYHRVKEESP